MWGLLLLLTALTAPDGAVTRTEPGGLPARAAAPAAAAARILDGLLAADKNALRRETVSEPEFLQSLWPWFRGADPGDTRTARFVWEQYSMRSEAGLQGVFKAYAGLPLELVSLRHGGVEEHGGFRLLTRPVVTVRVRGEIAEVRLFGSIIEQNGRFKVYGFKTD
jgi:hypothetical protein